MFRLCCRDLPVMVSLVHGRLCHYSFALLAFVNLTMDARTMTSACHSADESEPNSQNWTKVTAHKDTRSYHLILHRLAGGLRFPSCKQCLHRETLSELSTHRDSGSLLENTQNRHALQRSTQAPYRTGLMTKQTNITQQRQTEIMEIHDISRTPEVSRYGKQEYATQEHVISDANAVLP
jgi:hypothetical protein